MKQQMLNDSVIPIRLEQKQTDRIREFQERTGLSKSFIIRRCINFALEKFVAGEVDVLTFEKR